MGLLEKKAIEELKALPLDRLAAGAVYIHRLAMPDLQERRTLLQKSGGVLSSKRAARARAGVGGLPEA